MALAFRLFLFLWLVGCSTLGEFFSPDDLPKDINAEWRKNMTMKINGKLYRGLAVVDAADTYEILIYPYNDKIDRLQWGTCHGDDFVDNAVKNSVWPWKKNDPYFRMIFRPQPIELERACPLYLEELAERHKSMNFGMVIFPDYRPHFRLSATLECNREAKPTKGVSGCQAPTGTVHRIQFAERVDFDERQNEACPPVREVRPGAYEFNMAESTCTYDFVSDKKDAFGNYLTHRLFTYGYSKNPPPKGI